MKGQKQGQRQVWKDACSKSAEEVGCCCGFSLLVVSKLFCDPMDCSPPGSAVHGISLAGIVEWVAISFSRESFQPRDWTCVLCIAGKLFTTASWEAPAEEDMPAKEAEDRGKVKCNSIRQLEFLNSPLRHYVIMGRN